MRINQHLSTYVLSNHNYSATSYELKGERVAHGREREWEGERVGMRESGREREWE